MKSLSYSWEMFLSSFLRLSSRPGGAKYPVIFFKVRPSIFFSPEILHSFQRFNQEKSFYVIVDINYMSLICYLLICAILCLMKVCSYIIMWRVFMGSSKVFFLSCFLGSVLSLSSHVYAESTEAPMSKGEPRVERSSEMDAANTPQLIVTDSEGQQLRAKRGTDKTWEVTGMDLKGTIVIDSESGSASFQNSSKTDPLQDITITVNGTLITTVVNAKGQKRVAIGSPAGYTEQVDVINPSGNTITAKRISEGVWKITGTDMSGKAVKGVLAINPNTGFVAYKGSNGSFMYKEMIPVEKIVAGMASTKKPINNKMVRDDIVDNQMFPDVSSNMRIQVKKLIKAVLEKDGD